MSMSMEAIRAMEEHSRAAHESKGTRHEIRAVGVD
jgi:hypothetical protein